MKPKADELLVFHGGDGIVSPPPVRDSKRTRIGEEKKLGQNNIRSEERRVGKEC